MSSSVFLAGLENELKTGGDPSAFAYDHSFFAHLSAMEQLVAENLLIEASRRGDTKASGTLGNLGCVRALPLLDDLSASSPATAVRAAARRAVALIRPSSAASAAVAEDLAEGQPIDRLLASETLRQQPDEAATRGLLDALQVDDLFVRDGAWDGLLDRLGLPRTTGADDFGPLSALHLRVICTLKTVWNPATSRARKLFQRILAGEAPAVVIPTYVPGDPALRAAALATLNATTGDPINLAPILAMDCSKLERASGHPLKVA